MNAIRFDTIEMTGEQRRQLGILCERLVERNKIVNLTAITEPDEIREKHFADSLAILQWAGLSDCREMIDLGTGGGFPGLPVAITCPQIDVTMLDSAGKKLAFVDDMIAEFRLANARTLWARAEDAAHDADHREAYDLAVSRAVAPLPVLVEYALPFLRSGGAFVSYKGAAADEIEASARALRELGGEVETTAPYTIEGGDERVLIVIRKTGKTPQKYPRRAGKPSKSPII